jgi:hypothetical protein
MSGYLDKRSILKEGNGPIAIVSDFQTKFVDLEKIQNIGNELYLVHLKSKNERPNVCVDSVWVTHAYLKQNSAANEIKVRLRNTGDDKADRIVIELKVDKATIASQMVSIEEKSYLTISFQVEAKAKKDMFCQLKIDDGSWTFDNVFDFVLTPTKNLPIVLVADEAQKNPVKIAFDQEETFKCQFLKDDKGGTDFLNQTDLFVLEKQSEPNRTFLHTLFEEVRKGKSIVVFASEKWENSTIDFINKELGKVAMIRPSIPDKPIEMEAPDIRNPFFANMFENMAVGAQLPSITPVCLVNGADEVLLKTKSGNVALGEYMVGNGKAFIFPFGLGNGETFSRNAIFLPVLYRIAEQSAKNRIQPYRRVGDKLLEFECDSCNETDLYSLQNGTGKIIPEQKRIGNKVQMFLQDNLATGFWSILDKQGSEMASFGLNTNLQESEMSFYSLPELQERFSGNERIKYMPFEEFSGKVMGMDDKDSNSTLWRYVVAICFLFLLSEILIARYFNKKTVSGV